jgi:hypothetical protein
MKGKRWINDWKMDNPKYCWIFKFENVCRVQCVQLSEKTYNSWEICTEYDMYLSFSTTTFVQNTFTLWQMFKKLSADIHIHLHIQ